MKEELSSYLRGPFPRVPEGVGGGNADGIKIYSDTTVLYANGEDGTDKKKMWAYNSTTGEFIINYNGESPSGVPYDEL